MAELRKIAVFCQTEGAFVSEWTEGYTLATCPNNAGHTLAGSTAYIETESTGKLRWHRAGGAIAKGDVVSYLGDAVVCGFGSPTKSIFEGKSAASLASCSLSATTFVVCYTSTMASPTANVGVAIAGTIAGGAITWSAPVIFSGAGTALTSIAVCALSATDFIVVWRASASGAFAIGNLDSGVLTFSGVGSWLGSAPGNQPNSICVVKAGPATVAVTFRDTANSGRGAIIAGTYTGLGILTIVLWGTKMTFNTNTVANTQYAISSCVVNGAVLTCYDNNNAALAVTANTILIAVVTNGPTTNNIDTAQTKSGRDCAICTIDTTRALICYRRSIDNVTSGRAVVVTYNGATIVAGTPIDYTIGSGVQSPCIVQLDASNYMVSYAGSATGNSLELVQLTVDGGSGLTVASRSGAVTTNINFNTMVKCGDWLVHSFRDSQWFNTGCTMLSEGYDFHPAVGSSHCGLASMAAADGEPVAVQIGRRADFLTGLVPSAVYYAHGDGSLTTSPVATDNSYLPIEVGVAQTATVLATHLI